jgi:hypothetical protein
MPLLVQGLLEQLPTEGEWSRAQADRWLEVARQIFDVAYKIDAPTSGQGELSDPSPDP